MVAVAIHSWKGGTGKTNICVNWAALLAKKGYNVCLLDFDFNCPSLCTLFNKTESIGKGETPTINDFIDEQCSANEFLIDCSDELKTSTKGKYLVGFANPGPAAIRAIMERGRRWQMKALGQILALKRQLVTEMEVDHILIDTSPGVHYSSVNAVVAADTAVIISKWDCFDWEGTKLMIDGIYGSIQKQKKLLINKTPVNLLIGDNWQDDLAKQVDHAFQGVLHHVDLLGFIPCFCEVPASLGRVIFALEENASEHPFVQALSKFVPELFPD